MWYHHSWYIVIKHVALRSKSKDRLDRNQDNVSSGSTCVPVDGCFSEMVL